MSWIDDLCIYLKKNTQALQVAIFKKLATFLFIFNIGIVVF